MAELVADPDGLAASPDEFLELLEDRVDLFRDLEAEIASVEKLVPSEDELVYGAFVDISLAFRQSSAAYSEAFDVVARNTGPGDLETFMSEQQDLLERTYSMIVRIQQLGDGLVPEDFGEPQQETIEHLRTCNSLEVGPCDPDVSLASDPLFCPRPPESRSDLPSFLPWRIEVAERAPTPITDLTDLRLLPEDFVPAEISVAHESGTDDGGALAAGLALMMASCTGAPDAPPVPESPLPARWVGGQLTRATTGQPAIDPGLLVYVIEEHESVAGAELVQATIESVIDRCGSLYTPEPGNGNGLVVAWLHLTPSSVLGVVDESPFGDLADDAQLGASDMVWLRSGRYTAMVQSDLYGIATGLTEPVVELLSKRMIELTERQS